MLPKAVTSKPLTTAGFDIQGAALEIVAVFVGEISIALVTKFSPLLAWDATFINGGVEWNANVVENEGEIDSS
jgi:hypothetical protein